MVFEYSSSLLLSELGFSNLVGIWGISGSVSATFASGTSSVSHGLEPGSNHSPNFLISTLPFQ